jgi:hypothetical protein
MAEPAVKAGVLAWVGTFAYAALNAYWGPLTDLQR